MYPAVEPVRLAFAGETDLTAAHSAHPQHREPAVRQVTEIALSRKLFATTITDEKAIAAPAIIGLSKPNAPTGSRRRCIRKAQNRFCLITAASATTTLKATGTVRRSPRTSVMSPASIAASVPVPIAMPMSAGGECGGSR